MIRLLSSSKFSFWSMFVFQKWQLWVRKSNDYCQVSTVRQIDDVEREQCIRLALGFVGDKQLPSLWT